MKNVIILAAVCVLSGCTMLPQHRVLISPHGDLSLASIPANLRAYAMISERTLEERHSLNDLNKKICDESLANGSSLKRARLIADYNRTRELTGRTIIIPEAPATVVITQKSLDPALSGSMTNGSLSVKFEQNATNLGKMSETEFKAYIAYLAYIDKINADRKGGSQREDTFVNILHLICNATGEFPPKNLSNTKETKGVSGAPGLRTVEVDRLNQPDPAKKASP